MGGSICISSEDEDPGFFDKTVEKALQKLSKEDKLSLLKNFQDKFTVWKEEKTAMKEQYEAVYSSMIDDDWRDYVEDLKKKIMHNGVVGDYFKSTEELEEETKKLLSIVEVLENEVKIREKVRSELIWAKVISKIEAKVLDRETKVYEHTGSTYRRLIGYQASPMSLVSFVQSSSSSTGQGPATPQENEELPAETELQEQVQQVQQAQLVLEAHPVSGEKP